jgi:hypothetical protein
MSTIHILHPAAGQAEKKSRQERKPSTPQAIPSEKRDADEQQMMHAWSIGITNAGRAFSQTTSRDETCPPEVYIG